MTDIVKNFAPIILNEINNSNNVLLHCHPSPDPDSVGSALAMKFAIESMGKKVTLIQGDNEIPKAFDFPGVNTILKKSYGEVDTTKFDLFIALDSGDKGMITNKQEVIFPENMRVVVVDHHVSNVGYGQINCIDATYPATAQILYDLFFEMGIKMTHDIAINLLVGIYTDTGGFQYGNINADTFKIAGVLSEFATDFKNVIFTMNNSNRKEKLLFEGLALSSLKDYHDGQLAIVSVTNDQLIDSGIGEGDYHASDIVNTVKSVIGFNIAASLIERKKGEVKLSFRTRDKDRFDVSKIAVALGGGGHKGAAGAVLNMTMQEAIDKVVETAKIIYNL